MYNVPKNSSRPTKLEADAIVISGISGIYPNADNNFELCQKLYNKVDMVSKDAYPDIKHIELPRHYGKINGVDRFDAQFFRVTPNQAHSFEPVGRKVMEHSYSAMFDAGVNPETMKGTNLGVFVGFAQSDLHSTSVYDVFVKNSFILSGTSKTMMANRISYWVDAKGPSFGVDVGCASSMACLKLACEKMLSGECDAAIVCGTSHNTQPVLSLNMKRAGLLCLDGKTKCFDKNGDGYVRSEAVNILFLQKAKDAKRVYAEICHVEGFYFPNTDSSFLPICNPNEIGKFLKEFYLETQINPENVDYVEANAIGISKADRNELEGIVKVFGKKHPIKIGSIKSNLGHTESASGTMSVIKICLAYQKGELPANLHYTEPLDVPAVKEGKLQIVTNNTSFGRGYVAINNFSFNGSSYHALLKGHFIPKDINRYATNLPQLILVSGRHEEGVNKIFDTIENNKLDPEQIALLRDIFKFNTPGHTGRGFAIYDSEDEKTVSISKSFEFYSGSKRPVCFIYSGLGSQWNGMGRELMNIPIFADAIHKCHKVLIPKELDLVDMITNGERDIVNHIMHSLIGITAVQIGLTDVLTAIGINPDFIIGHSLGEIGCAYADGCLTAEEAILMSYCRGYVSFITKFIKGKMAAVGLGYKKVLELSPSDIDIACHNSSNSTTISGPAEVVEKFVDELKERNIFAKTVATSNIAFHSRYIAEAESKLLSLLKDLKIEPKRRSNKWFSTCYMQEEWENEASQFASAEYFTQNLINKVYFEEAAKYIPNDAIIIEIAPHGLMQAILHKSHANCLSLPLARRNHANNIKNMFEAIGKLYQNGSNPDVSALYPKVDFPVSTETPGLSHLVQWDHSVEWNCFNEKHKNRGKQSTAAYAEYIFSMYDDDYKFIRDYLRNGKNVYPESSLLVLVWKTLAMCNNINHKELSVKFRDVKFYDDIIVDSQEVLHLSISIQKGSNIFEVTNKDRLIVNGIIQKNYDKNFQKHEIEIDADDFCLTKNEVYKFLGMHGFSLGPSFQCIEATNSNRSKAIMKWNDDWTTFLDSAIQLSLLSELYNTPYKVKRISSLFIHVAKHIGSLVTSNLNAEKFVYAIRNTNGKTFCGGIVFESVIFEQISFALSPSQIYIQEFIPHFCNYPVNVSTAVYVNMQIVYENIPNNESSVHIIAFDSKNIVTKTIKEEISKIYTHEIKLKLVHVNDVDNANFKSESDVVVCPDFRNNKALGNLLNEKMKNNSFLMLMGDNKEIEKFVTAYNIELLTRFGVHSLEMVLLRKRKATKYVDNPIIVSNVDDLKFEIQNNDRDKLLILHNNSDFIPKTFKNIIKDQLKQRKTISIVDVLKPPSKSLIKNTFLKQQVAKGLAINVLRNREWGGYYSIPYKSESDVGKKDVELTDKVNITTDGSSFVANVDGVQVYYFTLCLKENKDIILKEIKKSSLAMDFSGIDSNGKSVMGCIPGGSIIDSVPIDPNLLWPVPEHWSLEDAATVPVPYLHAYYCLIIRHQLKSKSTVLVTEGASALGQAIISLCLSMRCKMFATVNSEQEKSWLKRIYPQIDAENIRLTVDSEFRDFIINSTNNERCNVVINCSAGEVRKSALACVGNYGHFLDLNDNDMKDNEFFCMKFLDHDKSYVSVILDSLFNENSEKNKKKLQTAIAEGIAKGIVKPLLRTVVTRSDLSKAIKLLTMSQNLKRILIKVNDGNNFFTKNEEFKEKRLILHPKRVYIVIWDGSEVGVEFINRLIERGAKYLIIHTRQTSLTGYYLAKSLSWTSVKIEISKENLNFVQGSKNLIESGTKMGDVDGIFIMNNDFEKNKDTDNTADLIGSNLDKTSRNITSLSYFVSLKFVTFNYSEDILDESERYLMERKKIGIPSLKIVFKFREMSYGLNIVSTILDGFEKSLKCKNYNVLVTDQEKCNKSGSELLTDIKTLIYEDKLKTFVDDIDSDECQATEPIISMKTLTSKYNEDEIRIDPDDRKAIMISGFLGHYKKLSNVAERLKISAIGLQIPPDMNGSISELAENLLQYIKMKFRLKSKFYIVAYSFGVNIALEVTALLEKEGYHGIVFCLDSSPLALQYQIKAYLQPFNEDQFQNSIINHTYTLLSGSPSQNLKQALDKCKTWSEKIDAFINDIKEVVSHSHDFLKDVVNAIYKRTLLAIEYKPDLKLNSEIVLIKGQQDPKIDILPDDYDLSKFTTKPVKVINITSDHLSVPEDCKISNIINGMLEPELLELFNNKNMCEVYSG